MQRTLLAALAAFAVLVFCGTANAQGYFYNQPITNSRGVPVPGANVSVCTSMATTAASVSGNIAALTTATNPQAAGYTPGSPIVVTNFTGADAYLNGAFQAILVTSTQISYVLTHADASATSNGNVVQQGSSTSPCAPLATIYTDQTLTTALSNPFVTDGYGNLQFWGTPQNYSVFVYGPSITPALYTVSAPCMPGSSGCAGSGAITGGVAGYLIVATGPTTGTNSGLSGANLSEKPPLFTDTHGNLRSLIQYVSYLGNDTNDGLSWGSAKATWDAACEALYTGQVVAGAHYCGFGTINITAAISACASTSTDGIWLLGNAAPGSPTTSTCWENTTGQIQTICSGGGQAGFSLGGVPICSITGGSATDNWHPGLWESGAENLQWQGVQFSGQGVPVILSYCPDHTQATPSNGCGAANTSIIGLSAAPNAAAGNGPGMLIGSNTLYFHMRAFAINGNPSATGGVTADAAAAILFGGGTGSGDIAFYEGHLQSGGIKVYGGTGSGITVDNVNNDNDGFDDTEAVFWLASTGGTGDYVVNNLSGVADCGTPSVSNGCWTIRNDTTAAIVATNVSGGIENTAGGGVELLGQGFYPGPSLQGVYGNVTATRFRMQTDDAAHEFPAITAPGTSLTPTNLNALVVCGTCTRNNGITDPSGGTQAIDISDTNPAGDNILFTVTSDGGAVVGDSYIISLWARPATAGNCCSLTNVNLGDFSTANNMDLCSQTGGQFVTFGGGFTTSNSWQHYVMICTLSAYPSPGTPTFGIGVGLAQEMQYAFPQIILLHGYSADDVSEMALHFGSWNSTCIQKEACSVQGPMQFTAVPNASSTGTTQFSLAKLTGAPSTAVIAATTDTSGILGIVINGAGTTGNAVVALVGRAPCTFDGATTAGDYVQISSGTGGDCHDTGAATYPTAASGQVLGRVLSTNGSGGAYSIELFPAETQAPANLAAPGAIGGTTAAAGSFTALKSSTTSTTTNCAAAGSAASPSVAACGAAPAGHFSCATNATGATCTVSTTAVTANSEIFVFESDTAVTATALGVTCNTSTDVIPTSRILASSIAATSFTINLGTLTTNPACFSYEIVN